VENTVEEKQKKYFKQRRKFRATITGGAYQLFRKAQEIHGVNPTLFAEVEALVPRVRALCEQWDQIHRDEAGRGRNPLMRAALWIFGRSPAVTIKPVKIFNKWSGLKLMVARTALPQSTAVAAKAEAT